MAALRRAACVLLCVVAKVVPLTESACPGYPEGCAATSSATALMQASVQASTVKLSRAGTAQRHDPDVGESSPAGDQSEDPFAGEGPGEGAALPSQPHFANHTGQPAQVKLALYLNNIDDVMGRMNLFIGEVIVACRYRQKDFPQGSPVALENGKVDWRNEVRREDDGMGNVTGTEHLYVRIHFDGRYDLFPFDQQHIHVSFHLLGLTASEAAFVAWKELSGIRPADPKDGRHFKTSQYYVPYWNFTVVDHQEYGMPYAKSRAQLQLVIGRALPYYILVCSLIPTMAIFFAILAFCLPITLIVPRVTVSFTSFLAMFVHVKQMTMMVPDGVWCWLMTDLTFFCTILAAAITSNMVSAKLYHGKEARLSEVHDGFVRWVLPFEFVFGQTVIFLFRYWHKPVGFSICGLVLAFHLWVPYKFYKAAELTEDHTDLFFNGLYLVMPFLFRAVHLEGGPDTEGPKDEVFFCPWLLGMSTHQSSEALAGHVTACKERRPWLGHHHGHGHSHGPRDIRGGGEEQATAAAQGDNDDAAHAGEDAGDAGGDLDMADGGDAGM